MPDIPKRGRRVLALGKARAEWFHLGDIRNEVVGEQSAADGEKATRKTADVYIFESIGGWGGVTAEDFVRDVAGLDVDHLDVHLNSPGGAAFEGVAIANVLRQHRADVTVWVDGIAASAASVIAMAGDEVVMGIGAQLMIHDASTITYGNAGDLRKDAEMLDSASNSIAEAYAAKAGGAAAEWRAVMQAETWYTGPEAVTAGLADRVATAEDNGGASGEQIVPGSSTSFWDMWDSLGDAERHTDTLRALYAHAGCDEAPAPRIPAGAGTRPKTPAATASGSTHKERSAPVPFTDEHLATLRTTLGLAADADEDKVVATVAEVMEKFVEDDGPPPGTVLVSAAVLDELKTKAEAGVRAEQQMLKERRERLVEAALRDGRIRPIDCDGWLNDLEKDPERKEATLASLTPGLVPLEPIGHAGNDSSNDTDANALYASVFGGEG